METVNHQPVQQHANPSHLEMQEESPLQRVSAEGPENGRIAQLQQGANASPQVQQLGGLQNSINQSAQVQQFRRMQSVCNGPLQCKKNDTGLPDQLKSGVENLSGMGLDDVKVHRNSETPGQLGAHAYAQGSDIHLAPGQEQHLPHEAWHVAQQKQGRVQATTQLKGIGVNDDDGLEREADVMGAKAMQMRSAAGAVQQSSVARPIVQGVFSIKNGKTYDCEEDVEAKDSYIRSKAKFMTLTNSIDDIIEQIKDYASSVDDEFESVGWEELINAADEALGGEKGMDLEKFEPKKSDWDSDVSDDEDLEGYKKARGGMSPLIHKELEEEVNVKDYRTSTARVTNDTTGYGFTSSKNSNLISCKGYNTSQSDYSYVLKDLESALGLSQSKIAALLLDGLLDTGAFNAAIKDFKEIPKNKIQFGLSLLINEIIGRSTSNLVEIVMMLGKTANKDDNELYRRLEERGVFIPNQGDHKGIGGQQLSRIGHGNLDEDKLDKYLTTLLQSNANLYKALAKETGAKNHEDLVVKLTPLFKKFGTNFVAHFSVKFK